MLHVLDQCFHDVLHPDRVLSRNDNLIVWLLDVDVVLGHRVEPRFPFLLLLVPEPIIDSLILGELDLLNLELITDPLIESFSSELSRCGSKRPDEAKHERLLDLASKVIDVLGSDLVCLCLDVRVQVAVEQAQAR